jgi:predicted membrane-bound mannosyltransferase
MMILTMMLLGLVMMALLTGLGFALLFYDQKRGQTQCDEIALNMAEALNADNRIGQMNTIVEHSRQLVYLDRQQTLITYSSPSLTRYTTLAKQVLFNSTEGATKVDSERKNQISIGIENCKNYARSLADNSRKGVWLLPWFVTNSVTINSVEFGSVYNTLSSSESPIAIPLLHEWDKGRQFIEKISNLYNGNINASLPPPDNSLFFYFSALPRKSIRHSSYFQSKHSWCFRTSIVIRY